MVTAVMEENEEETIHSPAQSLIALSVTMVRGLKEMVSYMYKPLRLSSCLLKFAHIKQNKTKRRERGNRYGSRRQLNNTKASTGAQELLVRCMHYHHLCVHTLKVLQVNKRHCCRCRSIKRNTFVNTGENQHERYSTVL